MYPKEKLYKNYERGADGRTPEQFISDVSNQLLGQWIQHDKGEGIFRNTGAYWENLLPIFRKYAPEKLKQYESMMDGFDHLDEKVKQAFDYGDDLLNLLGALQELNNNENVYRSPNTPFLLEFEDEEGDAVDYWYMPNQSIDQNYFGGNSEDELFK